MRALRFVAPAVACAIALGFAPTALGQSSTGPCTDATAASMPEGTGHDHFDIAQHQFACRMRTVAFDSLRDELGARNDIVLGEMDVKQDLAVVAVAYPEAGFLLFDVSDPAEPKFLSWYRGSECEGALADVDCGAFVDLSRNGRTVFLSVQNLTVVPGGAPPVGTRPMSVPGVEVVDISEPRKPSLTQVYPVVSQGGVHTSRSHVIPPGPEGAGRFEGEHLFSVANGFGIEVTTVTRVQGKTYLQPESRIDIDEVHDMFLQDDPLTGRTLMYVAAGMASGFYVYDVTDPGAPELLAEWDITPECGEDWYSHTMDVAIRGGRRYVTLPAELFDNGEQSDEDQAEGCGAIAGNGDKAGPLWIVDATDFAALGQEDDSEAVLKQKSERALVATWTNPANRAGGNLTFSPHNQQIVGDRIYLSSYHAGVVVLDASAAFRGERVRPAELGFIVPHGSETRPLYEADVPPLLIPFFSTFLTGRPLIWDMQFHKGYVLAADEVGGFYSLQYEGDAP